MTTAAFDTAPAPADRPGADPAWRRMRLWGAAPAVDDLYQGLVPASVPYFVLDRHYTFLAASGLTLAATLGSSLPQPLIGLAVDAHGPQGVLTALCCVPVPALLFGLLLTAPQREG